MIGHDLTSGRRLFESSFECVSDSTSLLRLRLAQAEQVVFRLALGTARAALDYDDGLMRHAELDES